jgi:lipopolysaccharide transport system permease protein
MSVQENDAGVAAAMQRKPDPAGAPPVVHIVPAGKWIASGLSEVWAYRELLYFMVWRDIKVRYKQTAFGASWAVFQPLITMAIFSLVFRSFADVPSDGLPYSVFAYAGLLPWTLFSGALTRSISSVAGQGNLLSKVYFPRLIIPIASSAAGIVDFAIAMILLFGMMAWYGIPLTIAFVAFPLFILLALLAALAVGLWLSALNVKYRDVGHTIPLLVQLWMFVSPVAYPLSKVPEKWRFLYSINPVVGVLTGFRWSVLGTAPPDLLALLVGVVALAVMLVGGLFYFRRMEQTFADVV